MAPRSELQAEEARPAHRPSPAAPIALFTFLALAIVAAGLLSYQRSAADLRRQKERELATIAALKVDEIERWRDERLVDAGAIAADPTLIAALAAGRARAPSAKSAVERWFEEVRGLGEYASIGVVSADRAVLFAAGDVAPEASSALVVSLVRRAIRERRPLMSDVHRHAPGDPLHLTIASPLLGGGPGGGAVLLRVDPYRWLFRMVQSWPSPSPSAETLLVRTEGDPVTVANEPRHRAPGGAVAVSLARSDDAMVRAALGGRGVAEGIDYRGVRVLAAMEPAPDLPWILVAKVDAAEALAPMRELRGWVIVGVLALILAAAAGTALWWRVESAAFERRRLQHLAERIALERRVDTEREQAQEALRASEAKFRAAFEFATLGILLVDAEGRLVESNRALRRMLDRGEDELRALTFAEVHAVADRPSAGAILRRMREGTVSAVELPRRLVRKDGAPLEVIVRASALRDAVGAFRFALAVVEDVTDKKRLEAQLVLADRMASVGTLAAGVAHEINNPLAFILANLEFGLGEIRASGGDGEVLRALEEARDGGLRVREIVRDLKAFSRADAGERETVDLRRVLQSALGLAQNEIRHRARLEVDVGDVPLVTGSEHRLGQVFLNLIINAAQAIAEGRAGENVVRAVTATSLDGRAVVEISDTGSGIAPEVLPRIFDPFFTTKPVGVGTGLGLSICHGIVSGLGGEIQVDSRLGRGSTFRVLLPPARPAKQAERPPETPAAVRAPRGRILVVDDEALVGRAVKRILVPQHDVVTHTSASAALQDLAAGSAGFDLVLCDLMMPDMTGMELHAKLSEIAPALAERIVFLTGGAFTSGAREFLARVPNARIEKPFEPDALRALVTRALAQRAA